MSDYSELKRLAEHHLSLGHAYTVATPSAVLALIAENERLRESDQEATELCDTLSALLGEIAVAVRGPEEPKTRHGFHDLPSRVKTAVAERDQLKADNEALRRELEGKVLCDLELFETLRDAANTEADEHRQCMATYRPLRQANLDSVVKKCDDLLAAMGKGEQS